MLRLAYVKAEDSIYNMGYLRITSHPAHPCLSGDGSWYFYKQRHGQ